MPTLLLTLILIGLSANSIAEPNPSAKTAKSSFGSQSESRLATNYDGKQAFARLILYLRERREHPIVAIWEVTPAVVQFFGNKTDFRTVVSEWAFEYSTKEGDWQATVNCWGVVTKKPVKADDTIRARRSDIRGSIQLEDWLLDFSKAHYAALDRGAAGSLNLAGNGGLQYLPVKGTGRRLVWGFWDLPSTRLPVFVDARTGEVYTMTADRWLQVLPRARLKTQSPSYIATILHEQKLHLTQLQAEESKKPRESSSWSTAGALYAAVGDWVKAVDSFGTALEKRPQNTTDHYGRGFTFLAIRDTEKATRDFKSLPLTMRSFYLDLVEKVRGQEGQSLGLHTIRLETDVGMVPVSVSFGGLPNRR